MEPSLDIGIDDKSSRRPLTSRSQRNAGRGRMQDSDAGQAARSGFLPLLAVAFTVSLAIPIYINLGGVRLTPYRIVLLVGFIPIMLAWLRGDAGPRRGYDWCIIVAFLWGALSLLVNHGGLALEASIVLIVETLGAFFLARVAIRNVAEYSRFLKWQFAIILFLVPFAIVETQTGQPAIINFMAKIAGAIQVITDPPRMGMERVQATFEHSILYGIFCASALGGIYYGLTLGKSYFKRGGAIVVIMASSVMSVSTGALAAVMFQFTLFAWDLVTRQIPKRWTLFALMLLSFYILIDLLSNRSPFHVLVSYMTFNTGSGWNRIHIWNYGLQNVYAHPLFGLGFNDWARAHWMGNSVDNFWLLMAMRYGVPTFLALAIGTILIIRRISLAEVSDVKTNACRAANLTVLGGLILASGTVHYWNTLFVWFIFLLGAATWVVDHKEDGDEPEEPNGRGKRKPRQQGSRRQPTRGSGGSARRTARNPSRT